MNRYQGLSVSACCSEAAGQQGVCPNCVLTRQTDTCQILAISTGEEEKQFFRSRSGVRFAAEAALESMDVFSSSVTKEMLFADNRTQLRLLRQLAGSIITKWKDRVREDIKARPFRPEEINSVENIKFRESYQKGIEQEYAYRANVEGAIVAKDYCLFLRNGDSECTIVEGRLGQSENLSEPVPWNKKCREYYSTSMCDMTAIHEFRYSCLDVVPAAVFLVSGSLRRCFNRTEVYHIYVEQMADILFKEGVQAEHYLRKNLSELSRRGNHEDVCLACAWSDDMPDNRLESKQNQTYETDKKPGKGTIYFFAGTCIVLLSMIISFVICIFVGG